MPTVLLSGYYGFNNLGDEAVLGGLLAGLRAAAPTVRPVVLSGDVGATERLHAVEAIPRMGLGAIRASLREADLFISGGGSLLQDVTSARSPLYYLGLLWLAQRAGVPTMALAQGMGPLRHPLNRLLARRILNQTRAITVRDDASEAFLASLGVDQPPIEVTADPAFLLEPDDSERLALWWEGHIPAGRPVIGVALRRWDAANSVARYHAISDALAALAVETGALLLFIPMQFNEDMRVALEISAWTPAENVVFDLELTPREMLALVARCAMIVAMRLHALIFATRQGVPAFGLAYDPKVLDFALAAGLPTPARWEELEANTLADILRQAWEARDTQRAIIADCAAILREKAQWNITRVLDVLGEQAGA
ncbi:MAG: colanic acid biosynthesis protein [bacterium ADurb.Bin429]|nr:MAG: colanic acid biosynthesis protein [bacterium ADurb.Bin429]